MAAVSRHLHFDDYAQSESPSSFIQLVSSRHFLLHIQFLQPEILFLRMSHVLQLRWGNPAVFLASRTECGIGDTQLAADLRY